MKSSNVGGRAIRNYPIVWSFGWVGGTESTMFDVDTTRTNRSCDQEVGRAGISAKHKSTCGNEHAPPERKQTQAPAAMRTGYTNKIKSTCGSYGGVGTRTSPTKQKEWAEWLDPVTQNEKHLRSWRWVFTNSNTHRALHRSTDTCVDIPHMGMAMQRTVPGTRGSPVAIWYGSINRTQPHPGSRSLQYA